MARGTRPPSSEGTRRSRRHQNLPAPAVETRELSPIIERTGTAPPQPTGREYPVRTDHHVCSFHFILLRRKIKDYL